MRALGTYSPILLVGPSWVGDMVMAASLVETLCIREPGRPVDVLAPAAALPIARLIPGVRRLIPLGLGHGELGLLARWKAGRALREEGYGKAIILPRAFKAAIAPFAAGIPERVGFAAEGRSLLLTDARADTDRRTARTIDRFVALGLPRGGRMESPKPRLALPDGALDMVRGKFPVSGTAPVVALCPGAEFGSAKRWPAPKFAALARLAHLKGLHVRILGGPKEVSLGAEIAALAGVPVDDLTGRTTLPEVAAILSDCHAVITNDSGLMHIASGFDRPMVALYGATPVSVAPPTSTRAVTLTSPVSCRPCRQRECPLGTLACLENIQPHQVMDALDAVLA